MELSKNEQKAFLVILFFLLIGGGVRLYSVFMERERASQLIVPVSESGEPLEASNPLIFPDDVEEETEPVTEEVKKDEIFVHICGSVKKPGVYNLPVKSRVKDFIEAAGGTLEDADLNNINMARIPVDGEQIRVPSVNDKKEETEKENPFIKSNKEPGITKDGKVNINTATIGDLDTLPGIGPVIAQRIIDYRTAEGEFKTAEDIKKVQGIGDKTFESIKDLIVVK